MTGPNSSDGIEESEKPKKDEADLYNELINGFSSSYVLNGTLNDTDKNALIRDIMTLPNIPGTNIDIQLQRYMAGKDEFTGLDLSKINIFQLRNKISGAFFVRKNNQEKLKEQILKDYQMSPSDFIVQLSTPVTTLDDKKLIEIIHSEDKRKKFLQETLGNLPETKNQLSILTTISETESANRINRLNEVDKHDVKVVLDKAHFDNKLDITDMDILIDSGYLNSSEVKELVKNFIPHLTLQQAIDIGFIAPTAAMGIRDTLIGQYADDNGVSLDTATKQEIQTSLSLSDVLISTEDYAVTDADYLNIAKDLKFKNFAEDLAEKNKQIHEELRNSGPASLDSLREGILGMNSPHLEGFKKFREGAVLEFSSSKDGEISTQYIKILGTDDTHKRFSFRKIGSDKINLTANSEAEHVDYNTFFENLKKGGEKISVYTQGDVDEKINSGAIETSEFQSYDEDDFLGENGAERKEKVEDQYKQQLDNELRDAKAEIEKYGNSAFRDAVVAKKEEQLRDLEADGLNSSMLVEKGNIFKLTDKLDDLDPDGKLISFGKGSFIETKENAFQIADIDIANELIYLGGLTNKREHLSFAQFLEAFKKNKAKRAKKLGNFGELVERVAGDLEWGVYKFDGKKLIGKDINHGEKIADRPVEFMRGTESDTLVKIVSISDSSVEIQRGEIEDTKIEKGKEKIDGHKLKIKGAKVERYSLNEFATFIESEKLVPDWKLGKKGLEVSPDSPHNERNLGNRFGGVMWKTFVSGRMSISELMAGGKLIPELVEEYFKKGSDIKAAKAALKMGKFLPKQMQDDLLIKVERAESESMDKALEDLGKIDSPIAVKRIEGWLLDKNTPEYNKEAGMLFMLSKYGHLTAKGAMYPYRGKFLWYEAMGGRVNDELFLKTKKELEDDGQNFSEEFLVWMLMKKQCAGVHYSGIKRRGRIHKEYEGKFKSGIQEEFDKGHADATNKRTAAKMVEEGMGEALGGTTTNAIGWMKKAVERGGSLEDMMEISFSIMFSGAVFDLDQATYLKAKGLWDGDGQPVISHRMMSSISEMTLFNDTVLELSKEISKRGGDYSKMYDEALKLQERSKNRRSSGKGYDEKSRLEDTNKFWKKYGKPLSRALNFSMQKDSDFSETDTIIKRNKGHNDVFNRYYNKASGYVGEGNYFKEDFVDDWAGDTGIFGLNTYKMSEKFLVMDQGGAFKKGSQGKKVWQHMYEDINNTGKKVLVHGTQLDSAENKQAQIKYVTTQLEEITAGLLSVHGGRSGILPAINNATGHLGEQFNKWGVHVANDLSDVSSKAVKAGEKRKYFERIAENIVAGVDSGSADAGDTPESLTRKVQKKVSGVQEEGDPNF